MASNAANVLRFPDAQARGAFLIGTNVASGAAVYISEKARQQGLIHLVGVSGSGKTTALHNLIHQDLAAGRGLALIEPHADLTKAVLATMPKQRLSDVILLDLMDCGDSPFGLNIFERPQPYTPTEVAKTASAVFHIFEKAWGIGPQTPQLAMVLRHVTRVLFDNRATFAEIPLLLQDEVVRERMVRRVTNPHTKAFWEAYERKSSREKADFVASTLNKVDAYLQEGIGHILSQERSTVDFRRIMDEGKVLLVLLSPQLAEMSRLVGTIAIAGILGAAFSRADTPEEQRRQFSLYIDEFQNFMTDDTAVLIHEARKWRLSPIGLSHQALGQLSAANRAAVAGASTRIVFRVSPEDAKELAPGFDTTPSRGEIIGQEPIRSYAPNPVEYLLRHAHPHPVVAQFTADYLMALDTLHKKLIGHADSFSFGPVWLHPAYVVEAQKLLNQALVEAMHTGRPTSVVHPLALFVLGGSADTTIREVFWPHLKISRFSEPGEYLAMKEGAFVYGRGDFLSDEQAVAKLLRAHPDRAVRVELFKPKRLLTPGRSFLRMLRGLREVMQILSTEPLLEATGQYQPKYQQRTYADMVGERANELSSKLPNYHARVRLPSGEEHVVKTHPAPQGLTGERLAARITRIKRQMRFLGMTRPAAEIDEEIRKRHERLRGSTGSDESPPTRD
jgi:hypothetical protein